MAEYQVLRQRHLADLATLMPEHVQRLRWPADRLRQERRDWLRDPPGGQAARPGTASGWPGSTSTLSRRLDLAGLPLMTKDDLMANWDRVATDRRLTLDLVEGHLAGLDGDAYLFDEPTPSPGRLHRPPGIFAPSAGGRGRWPTPASCGPRSPTWRPRPSWPASWSGWPWWGQERHPHDQRHAPDLRQPEGRRGRVSVTQPVGQIVAGLNAYQPLALMGYPSMLALLAVEAWPVGCGSGLGGSPPPASPRSRGAWCPHRDLRRPRVQHVRDSRPGPWASAASTAPASTSATIW